MSLPYMKIYWGDYLGDTAHLTAIEHGGYLLLIAHYWRTGSIPTDEVKLARVARMTIKQWHRHGPTILEFFPDGKNKRIDAERELASTKSEKNRRSAETRWNANSEPNLLKSLDAQDANAYQTQSVGNANHSHSQNIDKTSTTNILRHSQARGTRLPSDWQPKEHQDQTEELAKFRDYWLAIPGSKGVKLDWDATWRNWIRNAKPSMPGKPKERDLRNVPDALLNNEEYWRKRIQLKEMK